VREPVQRALSENLPVPSFSVRHFTLAPILWGLAMATGNKDARNLSLFEGLKNVIFSHRHISEVMFDSLDDNLREARIQSYLLIPS